MIPILYVEIINNNQGGYILQIHILEQTLVFSNDINAVETMLSQIEEILDANKLLINFIDVDGVDVYQDFSEYIIEHLATIKQINIKVQTMKQVLDESLTSLQQYMDRALPEVEQLADEFYQGVTNDTWSKFNQLMEGLLWVSQIVENIHTKKIYSNAVDYLKISGALREELSNLENALNDMDMVLTGDILKYEIASIMKELLNKVTITIDNEVVRNDLS